MSYLTSDIADTAVIDIEKRLSTPPEMTMKEKPSLSSLESQDHKSSVSDNSKQVSTVEVLPTTMQSQPLEFDQGGLRAWMSIFGAFLIQYTCFGYINAFGVYEDYYVRDYLSSFTPSDIGWIGGVQIFLTFSCGAFTGRFFDKGYFRHMLAITILLNALALFMLSISKKNEYYQVFLTNGVTLGLATGISYVPSIGIAAHYFHKKRPVAVGIISSGSALGATLQPIMLNHFFTNPKIGFHNGVRISAAINFFLLLTAFFLIKPRLPPRATNVTAAQIRSWFHPKKEPVYFIFVCSSIPCFLGLFFSVFYIQLDAILHGVDEQFAFYSLSILNAASLFGRILPALLAPMVGVFNLGSFCTIATGVVILTMVAVKDVAGVACFSIFIGFTSGAAIALTPAMLAHIASHPGEIGQRMGLYFGIGGILGLFATPISGALLTTQYHWSSPIIFAGIMMLACGFLYALARCILAKERGTQKL